MYAKIVNDRLYKAKFQMVLLNKVTFRILSIGAIGDAILDIEFFLPIDASTCPITHVTIIVN